MALEYSYVLPPTGPAENAQVREMFDDVKAFVDTIVSGGGSGAPDDAQYVTLAANANLTVERVLTAGTGVSLTDNGAGSTVVVANTGVTSAIGTANQVNVSGATGAVTFSLPQSIATSSDVEFNRLNLSVGSAASTSLYFDPVGSSNVVYGLWAEASGTGGFLDFVGAGSTFAQFSNSICAFTSTISTTGIMLANSHHWDNGAGGTIIITGPGSGAGYTLTLPTDDGAADQVLSTNGSGVLSWADVASGGTVHREDYVVGTALNNYTGSTTVFDLNSTYTTGDGSMLVSVDGVLQTIGAGVDYLETDTNTITFNNALVTGQKVAFMWSVPTSGTDYATKALDNLGSVAINTSLISDTDVTDDLGSSAKKWKDVWAQKVKGLSAASANGEAVRFEQNKVIQAVSATASTNFTTTSSTFQTSNLSASITPTSSSNKILVLVTGAMQNNNGTNTNAFYTVFRGSTDIGGGTGVNDGFGRLTIAGSTRVIGHFSTLDSPATTSSTTYTVKIRSDDNATTVGFGISGLQTIILMEVAP